jgi:integrase/recombinase XerD
MNSVNQEAMRRYNLERMANGIRESTVKLDTYAFDKLASFLGDKEFKDATKEDLMTFFTTLKTKKGGKFSPRTLHTFKKTVKRFYNWIFDMDIGEYPACVKWVRSNNPRSTKSAGIDLPIKPQDILTEEDVHTLINVSDHPRDQALIALIYESAARAEEALGLKVDSIQFDKYGGIVTLEGETGARRIRLVNSIPYLQAWLNVHPLRNNPKAPLWPARGLSKNMGYHNLYKLLKKLKRRSNIRKPVRPHLLRHARLTEMAKHLTDAQLKTFAGWTAGSRMTGTYVHLSGKDLDKPILEMHGLVMDEEEPKVTALTPRNCVRCKKNNPATAMYCQFCGMILDEKLAIEKINKQKSIMELRRELESRDREIQAFQNAMEKMQPLLEFVNSFETPENLKKILDFLKDDFTGQYADEKLRPQRIEFSPYVSKKLDEIAKRKGVTRKEALEQLVKEDLEILEKGDKKLKKLAKTR